MATSSGIKVFQNDGLGNFTMTTTIPAPGATCVDGAELNGDTFDDVVIAIPGISTQVFFNNGLGAYSPGPVLDTNTTTDLAINDFDGDTNQDVYVATNGSDDIIFLNTRGTGIFTAENYPEFQATNGVTTLDYDNDGNLDFFIGDMDKALAIRYEFDNPDIEEYQAADIFNLDQITYKIIPFDADNDGDGELIILSENIAVYAENILIGDEHIDCGE